MTPELFDHSTGAEFDLFYLGDEHGDVYALAHQAAAAVASIPGIAAAHVKVPNTMSAVGGGRSSLSE
jgi:hypothetical protein